MSFANGSAALDVEAIVLLSGVRQGGGGCTRRIMHGQVSLGRWLGFGPLIDNLGNSVVIAKRKS
jgi:hypothetical protein